jgi:fumarate reductase subunit C
MQPAHHMPGTYRPVVSTYWWLARWCYLKFILREASSVFVAWFVILTLLQIAALRSGPVAYADFQDWLRHPVVLGLNTLSLLFVIFHAVTWFNLAPKAIAVRMGGKRVPAWLIATPNYVAWLAVSAVIGWLLMRG